MKLYATVSSERASKGQGGNEFLRIELNGKDFCFGYIDIRPNGSGRYATVDAKIGNKTLKTDIFGDFPTKKGEKQKGDECGCPKDRHFGTCPLA